MRFIELPSYDGKEWFVINVESITHIRSPKGTGGGAATIFFGDGKNVDALIIGKDADTIREAMGLKPWKP